MIWLRVTRRFLTGKRWHSAGGVKNQVAFVDGIVAMCIKWGKRIGGRGGGEVKREKLISASRRSGLRRRSCGGFSFVGLPCDATVLSVVFPSFFVLPF